MRLRLIAEIGLASSFRQSDRLSWEQVECRFRIGHDFPARVLREMIDAVNSQQRVAGLHAASEEHRRMLGDEVDDSRGTSSWPRQSPRGLERGIQAEYRLAGHVMRVRLVYVRNVHQVPNGSPRNINTRVYS